MQSKMQDSNASAVRATLNPKSLELTLYPTEKCNFRCVYCYEDFALGRMTPRSPSAC